MKVIIGADQFGFGLQEALCKALTERGYAVMKATPEPALFQDAACMVARGVQQGVYDRGIALCGTGMGVSIVANKHRGVYAALCESLYQARRAKVVNNTNVLCMGGMIIGEAMAVDMAVAWLEAKHMVGLDPHMAKIVQKEFDALVEVERRLTTTTEH